LTQSSDSHIETHFYKRRFGDHLVQYNHSTWLGGNAINHIKEPSHDDSSRPTSGIEDMTLAERNRVPGILLLLLHLAGREGLSLCYLWQITDIIGPTFE
jgi:hypothetical protein